MQLRFSVLARNRVFSKRMRRVRVKLQPLLNEFETIELECPIHEAVLVGITDDQEPGYFEQVENNDGFFQVLAGCPLRNTDDEFAEEVFVILRRAMRLCPFATSDHETFEKLFERFQTSVTNS